MPYSNIITPCLDFQALLPIIPQKTFSIPFQRVLNGIDGVVTRTERRLLALLERFCYQDGRIYPKQNTLAFKLGVTVRQIQRLISALISKGFIMVVPSALVDRHCYGKGNSYHLLNHPAYGKMSPEMSVENQDPTININKRVKNKSGFDVLEWLDKNKGKHPQAVVDALKELTKRWPSIKFPGKYAQAVVDVQSGNYTEKDHVAQAQAETADTTAGIARIAEKIGFCLPGFGLPKKKQNTPKDRNAEVNALLDRFG